jgi:hypothetical protein
MCLRPRNIKAIIKIINTIMTKYSRAVLPVVSFSFPIPRLMDPDTFILLMFSVPA